MNDHPAEWRELNKRGNPACEGELLETERRLGHLSAKRRARVLGMFHVLVDGVPGSIPYQWLQNQEFGGVSFIGAVSTLHGQEGLHSQCLWYRHDQFDWFWVEITNVTVIELRADPRFRGSTPCLWLITPIAEYALTCPHSTFVNEWENVLDFFKVDPCDEWPRRGTRPHWWPLQSSGQWPGDLGPGEPAAVVSAEVELRQLTEQLSMQPCSSGVIWRRLGPKGDKRYPGHPMHHLGQLEEWKVAHNAGLKVTRQPKDVELDVREPENIGSDVRKPQSIDPDVEGGRGGAVVRRSGPAKRKMEGTDHGERVLKRSG